jgi:hypothetical protein
VTIPTFTGLSPAAEIDSREAVRRGGSCNNHSPITEVLMPPRYSYWTIILDGAPTAFRAHDREDLLPTLRQLQRRNPDAVMKWFARGRLWSSPDEAHEAARQEALAKRAEKRGRDWRPGGAHQDPRARYERTRDERRRAFKEKHGGRRDRAVGATGTRQEREPPPPVTGSERRPAERPEQRFGGQRDHAKRFGPPHPNEGTRPGPPRSNQGTRSGPSHDSRSAGALRPGRDRDRQRDDRRPAGGPGGSGHQASGGRKPDGRREKPHDRQGAGQRDRWPREHPKKEWHGESNRGAGRPPERTQRPAPAREPGAGRVANPAEAGSHVPRKDSAQNPPVVPRVRNPAEAGSHVPHGAALPGAGGKGPKGSDGRDRRHPSSGERDAERDRRTPTRGQGDQPERPETPPPQPPQPPGPDRPPRPGEEPPPDNPSPETIRIIPEPPERAK